MAGEGGYERTADGTESVRDSLREGYAQLRRPAFFLSLLYLAVYAGSFAALNVPLNILTARLPPLPGEFFRVLLPAAAGTALCSLTWPAFRHERRMMAAASFQMARLVLLCFILPELLLWGDRDAQFLILHFFGRFLLAPVLLCGGTALALFYRRRSDA